MDWDVGVEMEWIGVEWDGVELRWIIWSKLILRDVGCKMGRRCGGARGGDKGILELGGDKGKRSVLGVSIWSTTACKVG